MRSVRRLIGLLLTLSLAIGGLFAPGVGMAAHPFTDLPGGHYDSVISTLYDYGVVSGLEPTKFTPAGQVTRAQMAAFIIRAMGKTAEAEMAKTIDSGFGDVPADHWARGVITLASRAGIIKGDAGKFYPNDPVNYAQAATMFVRALGYEGQVVGGYPSGYVLKASELGLLKDVDFSLYGGVNRAEAAVLLYNAIFRAPAADNGLTWSQTVFKRAATLRFDALPKYVAPGQVIPLTATAADIVGNPINDAAIEFRVLSGSGQIRQRTLEAGDGGTITVQASLGSLTAAASATPVSGLAISPETFQANKGGTVQLSATALSGGQRVQVQPTWHVQSGPATVSAQGLVTVNDYGAVVVTATLGNLTASATGQAVGKVTITSKPEYVVPGLSYNLTASATDSTGRAIDVPITWTAVGATIDRTTGRLTNVTGNQVKVVAMAAGISEEITIPVIKSISITPVTAHVMVGKTVKFTAKGVDAGGKQYPVEVRWDRTVLTVGIIDASGALAGINSGTTDVVAELGSLRGYATVRVAGDPNRLTVSAPNASLPIGTGATTEITVKLVDAAGNHSPVNDFPISFVLTDTTKGTLNRTLVLSQQGEAKVTFTAGNTAGPVTIAVSAPGTTMSAQAVSLNLYQPTPSHIQLTATPQPLAAGNGIATISATLRDVNNNPVLATQNLTVNLSATSGMLGWLTSNSVVIQTGQSSASTSFISGNTAGTIQINGTNSIYQVRGVTVTTAVAGAAAKVKIRPIPGDTPVTGLSSLQVQVEVLDSNGVLRANDSTSQVELKVKFPEGAQMVLPQTYTAAASGGIATFQVPAYVVGTAELTAGLVGISTEGSTDTTTAQFVPGVFSNLRLTAQPASLPADGYSTSQIVAEVIDRSGAVLTTVNPVVTFYKLVNGNVTTALTDTKVQAVGGKAVLTVQSGRLTGTDTWYATAPGLVTENLATVTTTATSGDAYTLRVQGSTSFSVGTATTMTVQVVDQMGRVVTSDNGRPVTVTHSLPGVSISPASAVTQNGVATFVVLGTQAVSGTITLSTTGMLQPVVSTAISFGGGGSSTAYSLFASSSAASARTGSSVTVWVRVMDSQGSMVATDSGRLISASVTGSATVNPTSTTTSNGLASFTVTGNGVGNVVLTFTATGLQQPSSTLVISFTN